MKVQVKVLEKNDDIITLLEEWLTINNSQKSVKTNDDILVFLEKHGKFNLDTEEFDSTLLRLEKWAKANKKIILLTSSAIFCVCISSLPFYFNYTSNDKIEPGLHYVEGAENIIEDYNLKHNNLKSLEKKVTSPLGITLDDYQKMKEKAFVEQMNLEEENRKKLEEEMNLLEEERVKEEKIYIKLYSDIYGLDYEKVYQILSDITDNFKDENYINNYVIGESMMKNKYVTCTSKEMAILIAVRNLYLNSSLYNSSYENLKIEKEYTTELSYSYQISYITNVLGLDSALSYAICKSECNFNSTMFRNKNNPGGIKFGDTFATFPNKTAGFIEQSLILLSYKISGRETIESIGKIYAPVPTKKENESEEEARERNLNSQWVSNVTSIYNSALNQYEELFGDVSTISLLPQEEKVITEEEFYIKEYSDIYGLDYEKVYQILSDITDNFKDENYVNNYVIGNSKLNGRLVICHSKEMAILLALRNIYFYPEQYGYSSFELKTNTPYKSDLDYAKQIAHASNVLDVDPVLNYAICKLKSNFNSPMFLVKHNPNNIRLSGNYVTFPSPMAGFIEEAIQLLESKLDGKNPLQEIKNDLEFNGISEFTSIYQYVMKNYTDIFGEEEITLGYEKLYVLE